MGKKIICKKLRQKSMEKEWIKLDVQKKCTKKVKKISQKSGAIYQNKLKKNRCTTKQIKVKHI
mgnify:CR=1 FL=1